MKPPRRTVIYQGVGTKAPETSHAPVCDADGPCPVCGHQVRYVNCTDGSVPTRNKVRGKVFGKHTTEGSVTRVRALGAPMCTGSLVAVDEQDREAQKYYYA